MTALRTHTYGYPAVGPNEVDVALRDGSQPDLIKCSAQKGSEGANKSNSPTTGGASQSHAHLQHKAGELEHSRTPLPLPFPSTECGDLRETSTLHPLTLPPLPQAPTWENPKPGKSTVSPECCHKRGAAVLTLLLQIQDVEARDTQGCPAVTVGLLPILFPYLLSPLSLPLRMLPLRISWGREVNNGGSPIPSPRPRRVSRRRGRPVPT